MDPKAEFQCKMTVEFLKRMAAEGLLSSTELEAAVSLAKTRYHVSEKVHFALDIS